MMYNKLVKTCFFDIRQGGSIEELSSEQCVIKHFSEKAGQSMEISLACSKVGVIECARFRAQGGPFVIAGLEYLCRQLEGSALEKHPCFSYQEFIALFEIPDNLFPQALRIEDLYSDAIKKMKEAIKED